MTSIPVPAGVGATTDGRPDIRFGPVALVGVLAGFLAGVFGVGGGILIVPGLVLVTHMSQRLAHGTSLAAVVPISISSAISYAVHDNIDWPVAVALSVGAVGGAVIGTKLLDVLPHRTLGVLFAAVLLASAIRLFIATDADGRPDLTFWMVVALAGVGVVTGILAGLLGVGGGIVMVPAMILLFHIPPVIAKGTSAAVIIPTAIMGTWRNRSKGNTELRAALIIGMAGIVTAAIGGTVANHMSDTVSNVLFAALLVIVAIRLLWQLYATREGAAGSTVTLAQYLVAFAAVAAGALAQGSVGFGFGMIAAPILAVIDESLVPGAVLLLGLTVAGVVVWQERGALDWLGIRWAIVGRVFGTLGGVYAVSRLSHDSLSIVLGLIVLVAVGLSVWGVRVRIERGTLVGAGALSGLMGTLTSVGGPPMALVYQREQAATLRSTLAGFFLFGATFSLITLAATGEVGSDQLVHGAVLLPGLVVGLVASRFLIAHVDRGWTRRAVLVMSTAASVVLIADAAT